jgi:hypothetical protein
MNVDNQYRAPNDYIPPTTHHKISYSRMDAAVSLGFSLRTLDRLIALKEIHVLRIGRRVFITSDSLLRFIKSNHKTGGAN